MKKSPERLVAEIVATHQEARELTEQLAQTRARRRELAAQLHAQGHSYRWIGEQLGVTAQAVEGFLKYPQRRK